MVGVDNEPLWQDGKLRIPFAMVEQVCHPAMTATRQCVEQNGADSEKCIRAESEARSCMNHAIYNYVAVRKLCKREYSAWATCMNKASERKLSVDAADEACFVERSQVDTCAENIAEQAAATAIREGIPPQNMPDQI